MVNEKNIFFFFKKSFYNNNIAQLVATQIMNLYTYHKNIHHGRRHEFKVKKCQLIYH